MHATYNTKYEVSTCNAVMHAMHISNQAAWVLVSIATSSCASFLPRGTKIADSRPKLRLCLRRLRGAGWELVSLLSVAPALTPAPTPSPSPGPKLPGVDGLRAEAEKVEETCLERLNKELRRRVPAPVLLMSGSSASSVSLPWPILPGVDGLRTDAEKVEETRLVRLNKESRRLVPVPVSVSKPVSVCVRVG